MPHHQCPSQAALLVRLCPSPHTHPFARTCTAASSAARLRRCLPSICTAARCATCTALPLVKPGGTSGSIAASRAASAAMAAATDAPPTAAPPMLTLTLPPAPPLPPTDCSAAAAAAAAVPGWGAMGGAKVRRSGPHRCWGAMDQPEPQGRQLSSGRGSCLGWLGSCGCSGQGAQQRESGGSAGGGRMHSGSCRRVEEGLAGVHPAYNPHTQAHSHSQSRATNAGSKQNLPLTHT